jgi:5-deoxy-glucuronate isomerase
MPDLYFPRTPATKPLTEIVSPSSAPLQWLSLSILRLDKRDEEWRFETGEEEFVLDIFSGMCTVDIRAGSRSALFPEIGGRRSVFDGKPTMVTIPRDASVTICAETDGFEGALVSAPARAQHAPVLIYPEEHLDQWVGRDNWRRRVVTGVTGDVRADRLLVGETFNPPGNWSSSPPHKHDRTADGEVPMEEVYLYRTNPPQGFGLQRVYTAEDDQEPFDVTYAVKDGDVVVLPRGYHPVVAAPGYQLMYLWALAGEERRYGAWSDDPAHAWIKD